ncbi:hypothetical protein ACFWPY_19780 [Streptomyces sp. NPDC058527]
MDEAEPVAVRFRAYSRDRTRRAVLDWLPPTQLLAEHRHPLTC